MGAPLNERKKVNFSISIDLRAGQRLTVVATCCKNATKE
jgi:hypothetical protein